MHDAREAYRGQTKGPPETDGPSFLP